MHNVFDRQLERWRQMLSVQVQALRLHPRWRAHLGASDLVQETLFRAHQGRERFLGTSEGELCAWLNKILTNVVIDEIRKKQSDKRDIDRERSLQASLADSSARLEAFLAADQSSPSQRLEREELVQRVAGAVEALPEIERHVIIQRDLLGLPVAEIALQIDRTEKAVAGLLLRGRHRLRGFLRDLR
jgi:RNA polymerase sigma-70 factor (ECF subfamily)